MTKFNTVKYLSCLLIAFMAASISSSEPITYGHRNEDYNFPYLVSSGAVQGFIPIEMSGYNPDVDTGNNEDVWGGASLSPEMFFPSAISDVYISSDNASNTAVTILVKGVGADPSGVNTYAFIEETITLSGLTFTELANDYIRINEALVAGTTELAASSSVYVHTDTSDIDNDGIPDDPDSELLLLFNGSTNRSTVARFSVPDGYTMYFTRFAFESVSGGASTFCNIRVLNRTFGTDETVWYTDRDVIVSSNATHSFNRPFPTAIRGPADIKISGACSTNNRQIAAYSQGLAIKNRR